MGAEAVTEGAGVKYVEDQEPDYIVPKEDSQDYRYVIGKKPSHGGKPLVAICMNPSAASLEISDRTVNRGN